jgi:hypothetical protein
MEWINLFSDASPALLWACTLIGAFLGARTEFLDRLAHGIVPDAIDVLVGAGYGGFAGFALAALGAAVWRMLAGLILLI